MVRSLVLVLDEKHTMLEVMHWNDITFSGPFICFDASGQTQPTANVFFTVPDLLKWYFPQRQFSDFNLFFSNRLPAFMFPPSGVLHTAGSHPQHIR